MKITEDILKKMEAILLKKRINRKKNNVKRRKHQQLNESDILITRGHILRIIKSWSN